MGGVGQALVDRQLDYPGPAIPVQRIGRVTAAIRGVPGGTAGRRALWQGDLIFDAEGLPRLDATLRRLETALAAHLAARAGAAGAEPA
jgi:hypothetical protein